MSTVRMFEAIAAAAQAMSEAQQRADKLAELRQRAVKNCGNCDHWMKSSRCPLEKNVKGQTQGPSCNHYPCGKFEGSRRYHESVAEYKAFAVIT